MSRQHDKHKAHGFLDKFGFSGSGKTKKGSHMTRPQSESDFNEIEEMQAREAALTDSQVLEQFEKMLDDMNLSDEKRRPLQQKTIEYKRQLLSSYIRGASGYNTKTKSKLESPADYINALSKTNLENMSGSKRSHLIESLRITLTNNPVSWIQDFGTEGLGRVLDLLNECYFRGGAPSLGEHLSKIQLECLRCLKAVMNNTAGLKQVFDQKEVFALVSRSLDPNRPIVMQEAAKLLGAVCILADLHGHERVLEAITISAENKGVDRFSPIVQGLAQQDNDSLRVSCMQLINAIVNMPEDFEYRIFLRNEFMRAGLHSIIENLKRVSPDLQSQLSLFKQHKDEDFEEFSEKFDCIHLEFDDPKECYDLIQNLIVDTPAEPLFLAILQHLLCVRDDAIVRSAYFKLIEECVAQIVLHRSGYDPDFRAKKFEIDVDGLTNLVVEKLRAADEKRTDELNNKLDEALTQKQEGDAQIEQLKRRLVELEQALKSGGGLPAKSDFQSAAETISQQLRPPGFAGPPPPPPPPPGMGMGGPPPPPPPPGMGMGGPPPPPPPPGMGGPPPPPPFGVAGFGPPAPAPPKIISLPHGMKPKKEWKLNVPMKKAQWKTIAPQTLSKKSFWVNVNEETLASDDILAGLSRFSTKAPVKLNKDDNENGGSVSGKKVKDLRVLDAKAAQNLSILLGGSLKHMSFEAVKVAILRCDEEVLSANLLEQLVSHLPSADQLKKLEELQSQYEDLSVAEQFAVTISTVKRLVPRLKSLKFRAQYADTVQDIKPNIVNATAACEEIKNSKKLAKLLELVLLMGNVMNSGNKKLGQAVGFDISYLPELSSTKDAENRQTLLHYLVETVETNFPEVLTFDEELIRLDKAARVSVETVQKALRVMDSDIKNLETDLKNSKIPQGPDDLFADVMGAFAVEARQQCNILLQMFSKIESLYADLVEYFTLDSKHTVEDFLGYVKAFKDQFQQAYKDNVTLREREDKIQRAKEAKAKAEIEKAERLARKKALVDMNSAGDGDTGVMDNLLEALKTGQAFHRPEQKRKRTPRATALGGDPNKAPLNRSRSRSNIMVLSPSSRELTSTDINLDNGDVRPVKTPRKSSRDDQSAELMRRLREL